MNQLVPVCPPRRHSLFQEKRNTLDEEMAVDSDRGNDVINRKINSLE